MSDKSSDSRPSSQPSALLLMPTSDFTGLDDRSVPSLLPASLRQGGSPPLLGPDEDAEADSFVGQSPVTSDLVRPSPFSMFRQHGTSNDPFSEIQQPRTQDFGAIRPVLPSVPTAKPISQPAPGGRTMLQGPAPLPQFSPVPLTGQNFPSATNSVPPPASTASAANLYRMTGRPTYVAPPSEAPYQDHQPVSMPGPGRSPVPPVSGVAPPPPTAFLPGPPQQSSQPSGFMPRPFAPGVLAPTGNISMTSAGGSQGPPVEMDPGLRSYQIHPPVGPSVAGLAYYPVQHHWFYCIKIEDKDVWKPFSELDSGRLEETLKQGSSVGLLVSVQGGRYEVNVRQRLQTAIYWHEDASPVRRCSWFYRPDGENRFAPYEEEFAAELEESYKRTIITNDFHKRLVFVNGEIVVIHNPQVIVQFPASAQPDAYGNTSTESRPRVVKRGVIEVAEIPEDEPPQIDHLVLVVQGVSSTCGLRYRNIIDCVNSFRGVAGEMMKTHFKQAMDERRAGRIEFLPIRWHDAMRGHVSSLDRKLKNITLGSVGKLRNYSNDHLMDILIYRSPAYAQDIVTTVGEELNRIVQLFKSRNPSFTGGVSVAGHGLGAQILFDILTNQADADDMASPEKVYDNPAAQVLPAKDSEMLNGKVKLSDEPAASVETLDSILEHLGLSMYLDNFKKEQIDLNSLSLCEDSDIKDLGLPLGPRKKLQGFLKDYKEQQERKKREAEQRAQQIAAQKAQEESKKLEQAAALAVRDPLLPSSSNTSVLYTVGKIGIGCPHIKYPELTFALENFFALSSSVAMSLAMKGTESLGEEFVLPTCPGFFNIFHPFDPLAYRMEPLIVAVCPPKPVQVPHHKGRKRLHLELKESLTRIGYDLKQRIIESVKNTWRSINSFALGHKAAAAPAQDEVEREVDTVLSEMSKDADDSGSVVASSVADEDDVPMGSLNQGRRVDFVLQEKPIEIFNDYMFALGSYSCYWESEDTALMMLKEIYLLMGIVPRKPGTDNPMAPTSFPLAPPKAGFVPTASAPPRGALNPLLQAGSSVPGHLSSVPMGSTSLPEIPQTGRSTPVFPMQPPSARTAIPSAASVGLPPQARAAPSPATVGPPTLARAAPPPPATVGPPPLSGFVKK